MLKLDFKKAFDYVEWANLDAILAARGFDEHWRMWVSKLLSTSKTIVVLNEVSGRWLMCH